MTEKRLKGGRTERLKKGIEERTEGLKG